MATSRHLLVNPAVGGVFHCISRCVRRAFLCGQDAYSGQDFEHRRGWVRERLRELASVFAVDVYAYAVMSNHLHVVLGTDPGRVDAWEDAEVARRWLSLFPGPGGKRGHPPEESTIHGFCQDAERLSVCRRRLADVSWLMRCLNEPIARRANREDECTGRFWEGRFKCQRLEDAGALLACMAYVDLNPVRAGLATTPEASAFTSGQDRSLACRGNRQLAAATTTPTRAQAPLLAQASADATRDRWLVPLGSSGKEVAKIDVLKSSAPPDGVAPHPPHPWLADLSTEDYLQLLDWTGREVRTGKHGRLSADLCPVLERLDLDVETWVENVARYGTLFHRLAGKVHCLRAWAHSLGKAWLHGHRGARRLYTKAAATPS